MPADFLVIRCTRIATVELACGNEEEISRRATYGKKGSRGTRDRVHKTPNSRADRPINQEGRFNKVALINLDMIPSPSNVSFRLRGSLGPDSERVQRGHNHAAFRSFHHAPGPEEAIGVKRRSFFILEA